ncbi:SDR family oxidoreductase [Hymenobacter caeli]|uniref:dTDP-4-dehydrorhamnose reductase n=1 Tax=Hymenobacter caeli TaxID=2735894 RepID=A0ABX2FRQ4_9BACT|nr:NAD(P)-dependent oxidoreductase [Hymenobacter caeli]NRT19676.1 dTDP-4-dehydrorhamnose reductase [Hymenobacter caeli]
MPSSSAPLLIAGASGTLGRAFQLVCRIRGLPAVALDRAALDIADAGAVARALRAHAPWAVVNAAGYVRVDAAEADAARCCHENTTGPAVLAAACAAQGPQLLTFSSDLVFDGRQAAPYREDDPACPLGVYGRSKLRAEEAVLARLPAALVVRTSAFFSAWDAHNFVAHALGAARRGEPFAAADDLFVTPTYVPDLVNTALDLLLDGAGGRWHLANQGTYSWAELARLALGLAGLDAAAVVPRPAAAFGWAARRPRQSALASVHGALLPSVESGLQRHLRDEQLLQSAHPPAILVG